MLNGVLTVVLTCLGIDVMAGENHVDGQELCKSS